jgi:glycosyltransferase involved in cell wall biosynthesis
MRTSVLLLSSEPVGPVMAGPAIRALELGRALADECDVTLAAPAPSSVDDERVRLLEAGFEDFRELLSAAREHDVVVAQEVPPTLLGRLRRLPARLVVDLYNPIVMEVLEAVAERSPREQRRIQSLIGLRTVAQCASADFIVCASEKQRDLWLGGLALGGLIELDRYRRDPTLRSLIDVVPFGIREEPPTAAEPVLKGVWPGIGEDDTVLMWAGGIWSWLDPVTPMDAIERLAEDGGSPVHLFFLGVGRPGLAETGQAHAAERAVEEARRRGLEGRLVHFNPDWVPYAERGAWLLESDLGVSAHLDHLESRFSYRTRVIDYLWARLPVVTTYGDAIGELVERNGLGATVPPEDPEMFAWACRALLDDRAAYGATRDRIDTLAPYLYWGEVVKPLLDYCLGWRERPAREPRRGALAMTSLRQYPVILREAGARGGPVAAVSRVLRRLWRALAVR